MEKIDVILPNRIGDSILTLPAVACLKQLIEESGTNTKVEIFAPKCMVKLFQALQLFPVDYIGVKTKIKSWIKPSDIGFFLVSTSKYSGFKAKVTYGQSHKKYLKFTYDTPYLSCENIEKNLPKELLDFLSKNCGLSLAASRYFGMCLDLGYSVEDIKSTFLFNKDSLPFAEEFSSWKPAFQNSGYVVICMEAAYNKKSEVTRRWPIENYFELAEKIYAESGMSIVFVGVNNQPAIPAKPYFIDLRRKLYIPQLAQLMKHSNGYVGNITGPLHLANLMKKPAVCIALLDNTEAYRPIFKDLVHLLWHPPTVDSVLPVFKQIIK